MPAHPKPIDAKARSAQAVASALAAVHPLHREALLRGILQHASEGLAVIAGRQGAAEAAYSVADRLAVAR